MLIGAWKSFVELEESLTLNELFELYEGMMEKDHEDFRRNAGLQGIEVPEMGEAKEEPELSFKQKIAREKARREGKNPGEEANKAEFGGGVGYKLIGG